MGYRNQMQQGAASRPSTRRGQRMTREELRLAREFTSRWNETSATLHQLQPDAPDQAAMISATELTLLGRRSLEFAHKVSMRLKHEDLVENLQLRIDADEAKGGEATTLVLDARTLIQALDDLDHASRQLQDALVLAGKNPQHYHQRQSWGGFLERMLKRSRQE